MSSTLSPAPRVNLRESRPRAYGAMARFAEESTRDLPADLVALVNVRVSIINGCVYCLVTHGEEARAAGIDQRVLDTLPAWRESPLFTPAERAALDLADAVTELGPHGVPDDVYAEALRQHGEDALAALLLTAVAMNAWNRIAISTGMAALVATD